MSNIQYIQSTPPRRVEAEITNPGAIGGSTGGATEAKQDSQITEMQAIRSEIGIKDIFITLKTLIQAISYPAWFDRSQNLIRTQVSGSLTTVSTVTTVTGVTNIDGYQGKMQIINQNQSAWANVVRSRIS